MCPLPKVFRERYVYHHTPTNTLIVEQYQLLFLSKIQEDWPGLPNDIDAAVTIPKTGHTYFFKEDLYWKFENQNALAGYPKRISTNWDGIPNNLDTAFRWAGKVITYWYS